MPPHTKTHARAGFLNKDFQPAITVNQRPGPIYHSFRVATNQSLDGVSADLDKRIGTFGNVPDFLHMPVGQVRDEVTESINVDNFTAQGLLFPPRAWDSKCSAVFKNTAK